MMGKDAHIVGAKGVLPGTQAVERALALLVMVSEGAATTQQLAAGTRLPRSTALRLLQTLERRRFLTRRPDRTWSVGPAVVELAAQVDLRWPLIEASRPHLEVLVARAQETAVVCVREGLESVCLEKLESARSMRVTVSVGTRTPLHTGATARTLLAFAPAQIVEEVLSQPLDAYTEYTVTRPDVLRTELSRIHRVGYGYSESEIDIGAYAIAAPIRGATGEVVGALAVAGPVSRMTPKVRKTLASTVVETADSISAELSPVTYRHEMEG